MQKKRILSHLSLLLIFLNPRENLSGLMSCVMASYTILKGWPKKRTVESSCRVGRLVLGLVGLVLLVLGLVVQTRVRHSSREREGESKASRAAGTNECYPCDS